MTLRLAACWSAVLSVLLAAGARAQEIVAAPTNQTGVYAAGAAVEWSVSVKGPGAAEVKSLAYTVRKGVVKTVNEGTLDLDADGKGTLKTTIDGPGTLLAEFKAPTWKGKDGKPVRGLAGAVAEPGKIEASAPPPADFEAFWRAKLADLAKVPVNAKVEPASAEQKAGEKRPPVEYFKVTLDNIAGSHVYGQLAKPKREGKFPALLLVQYAGVYGLPASNVVRRAEQGWLTLNIMPHDLPFDQPAAFYEKQAAGPLKDYVGIGSDDRETSYFLRMCLGCYRAAEYLAGRDDWDGRTLVVMGTSQGGFQAFVTAGLHPKVTAMLANVPAGCDATGDRVGRSTGWPYWKANAKGRDLAKITEASRYYDAVNFARQGKCPALVSMGLIDESCPPAGVLSACNVRPGRTETVILPKSNHHGTGNAQAAYTARAEVWLKALAKGEEPK